MIPMILRCPSCNARHLDVGEFATKPHHTHACQNCGTCWRPAVEPTTGVQFLPGFKNEPDELATLKRQHEQLRAAAEDAVNGLTDDGSSTFPTAGRVERVRWRLDAALDATPAEPSDRAAKVPETYVIQQLEAKAERLKTELAYAATELERAGIGLADAGLASHIRDALKAEANR